MQAERDDSAAKLRAAENIKELLSSKLRDTEATLQQTVDAQAMHVQQAASTQEIVSYLDTRNKELEHDRNEALNKVGGSLDQ